MERIVGHLHRALRKRCGDRLVELFEHRYSSGNLQEVDLVARYRFANSFLYFLENFEESDFTSDGDEAEALNLCLACSVESINERTHDRNSPATHREAYRHAVLSESTAIATLIKQHAKLKSPSPLPFRKVMSDREYRVAWEALYSNWGGDWVHGPQGGREHSDIDYGLLRVALESRSVHRVLMLHPLWAHASMTVDVVLINSSGRDRPSGWFPPKPVYLTCEPFDWYVYQDDGDDSGSAGGWIDQAISRKRSG